MKSVRATLREQLNTMPDEKVRQTIFAFPDQDYLNKDGRGTKRDFPVGKVAAVQDWTPNQRYRVINEYCKLRVPEVRAAGVTFRSPDTESFDRGEPVIKGTRHTWDMTYHLIPEPENEHDPHAVKVCVPTKDGDLAHVGYVPAALVRRFPIKQEMQVNGIMTDTSNGKGKQLSYRFQMDVESFAKEKALEAAMGTDDPGMEL